MNHKKICCQLCVAFSIAVFGILNIFSALQLIVTNAAIKVPEVAYKINAEIEESMKSGQNIPKFKLDSNGETLKVNAVEIGEEKEQLTSIDFRRNKKSSKDAAVTKNPGQVAHHQEDRVSNCGWWDMPRREQQKGKPGVHSYT